MADDPRPLPRAPEPPGRDLGHPSVGKAPDLPAWTRDPVVLNGFLEKLAERGNASDAARRSGLARATLYHLRAQDQDFARAWAAALELGNERAVDELRRRAVEGVEKPVYYKGKRAWDVRYDEDGHVVRDEAGSPVYEPAGVREYSDGLLVTLLKAYRPEFREKTAHELTGPGGAPLLDERAVRRLSDEELATLRSVAAKIKAAAVEPEDAEVVDDGASEG